MPLHRKRIAIPMHAVCLLLLAPAGAAAQTYPARPVHVVVPFPSGGTDFIGREVHHKVIDQCLVGKTGRELFELARTTQIKLGLPFTYSHNGHSIGLSGHEHPIINPHEDIPYEAEMITTVETRVRFAGKVGYHMEDIIEITDGAPIWHAKYFPNEELLVVG